MHDERGFAILETIIALLILALVGIGVYAVWNRQANQTQTPTPTPQSTTTPTPNTPANTTITPSEFLEGSFQGILAQNCLSTDDGTNNSYYLYITPENLPILIDENVITLDTGEDNTLICIGTDGTRSVSMTTNDGTPIYLYDDTSEEPAHGGPPLLGAYGSIIYQAGDTSVYVYVGGTHVGPWFTTQAPIRARGIKALHLSNDETAYVVTDIELIEEGNIRVVSFLNQYAENSQTEPGMQEISDAYTTDIHKLLADEFFTNLNNLSSPERENMEKVYAILGALSAK